MSDTGQLILIIVAIILTPIAAYILFRVASSAIFRSWFESKREFEKKEVKVNGRKDTTQDG